MAGNKIGGAKAAAKNKELHGADFYARIGKIGGQKGKTGGFYYSMVNGLDWHREAGRKGGTLSKRGPSNG